MIRCNDFAVLMDAPRSQTSFVFALPLFHFFSELHYSELYDTERPLLRRVIIPKGSKINQTRGRFVNPNIKNLAKIRQFY